MMQTFKCARHFMTSTVKQAVTELSVPVPWGEIRGKVWGPEHGRPVLCIHGWSDNCGTFNRFIPLLPKDCRYVAMDLAGHGFSSHRPPGVFYSFPSYVADVCRVVNALRWDRFSIIGHSMGGNVAGMYSALYPEMVDAVVLLDSYGFLPTETKMIPEIMKQGIDELLQFEKKSEEKKDKIYTYEEAVKRLSAAQPTLSKESLHILLERGVVQSDKGVMFSRDMRINLKNIARISCEQSLAMQSRIRASVLVILAEDGFEKLFAEADEKKFISAILQGYRDQNVREVCLYEGDMSAFSGRSMKIIRFIDNSGHNKIHKVVTVPGDHHVHLNNPECVAPLVSDFLHSNVPVQKKTPKL